MTDSYMFEKKKHSNLAEGDFLTNNVDVELNVLRALMLDGVGSHVHPKDVITQDDRGCGDGRMRSWLSTCRSQQRSAMALAMVGYSKLRH